MATETQTDVGKSRVLTKEQEAFDSVKALFLDHTDQLRMAMPKIMTPERLIRIFLTEINKNPELLECTPASLMGALMLCGQTGLEPGPTGHAYLVPFWNEKKGRKEVQFLPGYKGLVTLARRSGEIGPVQAHWVYEKDNFDYAYGMDAFIRHVPSRLPIKDRGKIVGFYCVISSKDKSWSQFEFLTLEEVEAHRDKYSKAAKNGPWVTNFNEMGLKTAVRKTCKLAPASAELQQVIALDELAENQLSQGLGAMAGFGFQSNEEKDPGTEQAAKEVVTVQEQLRNRREGNGDGPPPKTTEAVENAREVAQPDEPPPTGNPPPTKDISDQYYKQFLACIAEDGDLNDLMKKYVADKWKPYKKAVEIPADSRRAFMLALQDEFKSNGFRFEAWVK